MTVKEIMERAGMTETGRAIAYIKDGLEEINLISETHIKTARKDITKDKRLYELPNEALQLKDIRIKNHFNSKDEYRSIPRLLYNPLIKDADGE
ncbi:MAG: hypothetical protein Tp152DCM46671_51 [Prokaryotic dsDNA virus sp.]|nr:MAG: hypothetical protein Tp152DCM46671_51 [Prokaryotic dsDNA virus sp.]|tara:strand:- start:42288 stop:42569 length:282 start_codon:yes stop_codon:yes gene_type:complete